MTVTELDLDDLRARATRAAQGWVPGCTVGEIAPLSGGASSLTFTAHVDGVPPEHEQPERDAPDRDTTENTVVLKVAPPGLEPVRNRDVARQARLMRALAAADGVRVPTVLFEDDGAPPAIPPFHAMNLLAGDCVEPVLIAPPPAELLPLVPARAHAAAAMLAALHRVDPAAVGLGSEPVTTLDDEIRRWTRAFGTVDDALRARHEEAEAALFATMPTALAPAVGHGDYRLGNMLCSGDEITAIIDWELWSLADPRLDLAWFVFFTDEAKHPMAPNVAPSGVPSPDALLATYMTAAGAAATRATADMEWFHCLIRYKEAAASALLYKRMVKASGSGPANWEPAIQGLIVECIERLSAFTPGRAATTPG
ncbi:MAG TPA: phosphotransferase family protein [Acidimicrobiia bacterium]|nr:phosphotransferase family protein [Acidimicrobiia bacterium]